MNPKIKRCVDSYHLVIFDLKNEELYTAGIDPHDVTTDEEAEEIVKNFGFSLKEVEYRIVKNLKINIL